MKKIIALFFVLFILVSCNNEKPKEAPSKVFLENQLSEFITNNPDWTKDEATEAETTEKFKHKAINWSNEPNFLNGMPLQLSRIADTIINEQPIKLAHFKAYSDKARKTESLLNYMQLHIMGIISEAQEKQLNVGQNYQLQGTLQKQGKRADVKFIKVANFKGYDLGKYTFLITGFNELK